MKDMIRFAFYNEKRKELFLKSAMAVDGYIKGLEFFPDKSTRFLLLTERQLIICHF